MSDNIDDIIAPASLLLAVITALLSIWYADVARAIDEKVPKLPAEKKALRKRLAPIFWSKSLPLAISSTLIAGVFIPRLFAVVWSSLMLYGHDWYYDDMKAAFVATGLMLIALAIVTLTLAVRLAVKCLSLREYPERK